MKEFTDYSSFYDLTYAEKDYASEAMAILEISRNFINSPRNVLDLGCGTGTHCGYFLESGLVTTGVDQSSEMITIAKEKFPEGEFLIHPVKALQLNRKFDLITSLFHVMSYQVEESDLKAFFETIRNHLNPGAIAIADYWNSGAARKHGISKTRKEFPSFIRTVEPEKIFENSVTLKLKIESLKSENVVEEIHAVRWFDQEELYSLAEAAGLIPLAASVWPTLGRIPGNDDWNAFVVLKRRD